MKREPIVNMNKFDQSFIIAHMPGYVYWKNKDSQYMGCNNNLAHLSGLKHRDAILGKTDFDFEWGNAEATKFVEDDQHVMRTQRSLTTEYQLPIKREDGNYLYVRTEKMPFYNEEGEVIGVLAIAVDVTEIKLLENNLRSEKEQVEKLSQIKTEFIRNMEHDIRTPFSGIYTIANNLASNETNTEKKQYLAAVAQGAKELLDYCNNILDFSRIESGAMPILYRKFNLKKLIDSIVLIEKSAAQAKKLMLLNEYGEDLPAVVLGDNNRLKRILINLVSNAIKFTPKGYIRIQVRLVKNETINEKIRTIIRFIIQDTGIGIPKEQQHYIYEKFTKLTPSNRGGKGYGLGLPIVKQLMADINGEIDVKSEPSEGTIVFLTIPFDLPLTDEIPFEE